MTTLRQPSTKKKVYRHSVSESSIQKKFIAELKRNNPTAFIVKLSDKWVSGLPDVMMILDGHAYFFELKTAKGVVTEIQKQTHQALLRAGADVAIVRGGELGK